MVVIEHFRKYGRQRDEAVQALFPLSHPVADAIVEDCKPWTEGTYALSLTQVRIMTQPKPAFNGMLSVPWKTKETKELASALARVRVLEGREKDQVYEEFQCSSCCPCGTKSMSGSRAKG
jgi:hypothetical protein